jgi:2-O-(6-phospho-alpha-D-mannosyl)-D-glycerate hydrolase
MRPMPARAVIHVVPHTHWDREWYEPFEAYRVRLIKTVDRLIEVLEGDPGFRHFHFDGQTAAIEDYLEAYPEDLPDVSRLVADGRLAVGPWRILMDEFLCSPETIVRNLRQGIATMERLGGSTTLGYIPDSFGHIGQMPQILALAGMTDACVWRGVPFAVNRTAFWWEAPDGTRLRTLYLATSYSNGASLPETFEELMVRAKRILADLTPFHPGAVALAMNGTDHRGAEEHLPRLFAEANARQDEIEMRLGSMAEYVREAPRDNLPVWRGEMRSSARANLLMGVLSARMPLKLAEFRASTMLERYAEPLSAIAGTDPGRLLDGAWRGMVENSAHDSVCGCGVDAVADQVAHRYEYATRVADLVARDALDALAARIDAAAIEGEAALIFNPSPSPRGGVCELTLTLPCSPELVGFRAPDGTRVPAQALEVTPQVIVDMKLRSSELARMVPTIHSRMIGPLSINSLTVEGNEIDLDLGAVPVGHLDVEVAKREIETLANARPRARFHVRATGPPIVRTLVAAPAVGGLGWTVLIPEEGAAPVPKPVSATEAGLSNEHLDVRLNPDGTVNVTHRATGTTFAGALMLRDVGDAGDEYNYSPPERDLAVDTPAEVSMAVDSEGPLEARVRIVTRRKVPAALAPGRRSRGRRMVWMPITISYALRAGEPFLRADITVDNNAEDHRLRVHVPLPFRAERSHGDAPFWVQERAVTAEGAGHEHPLPTFPARRFADASDGDVGIAVLLAGTPEFELVDGTEIAVTLLRSVGWLSRQDLRLRSGPAGPAFETRGAQLKGEHRFSLALYPHAGDWKTGEVPDAAERFSLPLRATGLRSHAGALPHAGEALRLEPSAVRLSALERRDSSIEARVYNATPEAVEATIHVGAPLQASRVEVVDLLGKSLAKASLEDGKIRLPLGAGQIVTIRLS